MVFSRRAQKIYFQAGPTSSLYALCVPRDTVKRPWDLENIFGPPDKNPHTCRTVWNTDLDNKLIIPYTCNAQILTTVIIPNISNSC